MYKQFFLKKSDDNNIADNTSYDNVPDNAAGSKRDRAKQASRPIPARVHPFVRPQSAI